MSKLNAESVTQEDNDNEFQNKQETCLTILDQHANIASSRVSADTNIVFSGVSAAFEEQTLNHSRFIVIHLPS